MKTIINTGALVAASAAAAFGLAANAPAATCSTAALPTGLYLVQAGG